MLKNIKVGTLLITGFLMVAVLGAIVGGIGVLNMARMIDEADHMYERELLGLSFIKEANINLIYMDRAVRGLLLAASQEERKAFSENLQRYRSDLGKNLDRARPLFSTGEGMKAFAELEASLAQYNQLVPEVVRRIEAEPLPEMRETVRFVLDNLRPRSSATDSKMSELGRIKEQEAEETFHGITERYVGSRRAMIFFNLASVLAGIALGVAITRNLTRRLGGEPAYAAQIAHRIATGDLTGDIHTRPSDTSSLLFAIKTMRDSLVGIVSQVRTGTETIASASRQIAAGNIDLSSRTEEQASSLEETAASMEELTSTVKQNGEHAREANTLACSASSVAGKGGNVVAEVVATMEAITESSRKIVEIIAVIDGIAFQTNILALNAAVEAARAGEEGRGFAVVAAEVRNLAQRSATAAREIKALIGDSVDKIDCGGKLVNSAGAAMQEIVASVNRVTAIMSEISAASEEQAAGIEQVNQAISQMDQVTQQNASLVEEAAAASEAMQEQARHLARIVSVFKLEGAESPARPLPRTAARLPVASARRPGTDDTMSCSGELTA